MQIRGRIPFGKAGNSGTPRRCQKTDDVYVGFLAGEQPAAFAGVDVFHAIEGEYILEIGSGRFRLKSRDSILAPRDVPHAWAFVGDTADKMLIAFAPAYKMKAFFREAMKQHNNAYSSPANANDKELFHAYRMELLGPPLAVE